MEQSVLTGMQESAEGKVVAVPCREGLNGSPQGDEMRGAVVP